MTRLSLVVILVPAVVAIVRLLSGLHRPFTHYGDLAILEAAVRHVATGTQALGPYSRFGFRQPGPAYFFAQAPFSWLSGGSPHALFLGATVINFAAALGCVLVVRRWCGEGPARWAAAVVTGYILAISPALVTDPWNPYVLGLPLLTTILLAAAGAAGSVVAGGGAVVLGSYVLQTHVATAATLLAVFAVTAGIAVLRFVGERRRRRSPDPSQPERPAPRRRRRSAVGLGVVAALVLLLWTPPLVEQATRADGNFSRIVRFFSHDHPEYDAGIDHGLATASRQVAAHLATLPFGRVSAGDHTAPGPFRLAVAGAGLVVAAAVAAIGWRRRQPFVAALGAATVAGSAAAVWATTRVVGEVMPYLLVWTGVLLIPAWIAVGVMVPSGGRSGARVWSHRLATALAAGLAAMLAWSVSGAPLPPVADTPEVASAVTVVRPWLQGQAAGEVRIRIAVLDQWPLAAGLVNRLDSSGLDVTVDREWAARFGPQFDPTGAEVAEIWVTRRGAMPPVPGRQHLGSTASASLWAGPLAGGGEP